MPSIHDSLLAKVRCQLPPGTDTEAIDAYTPLKSIGFGSLALVELIVNVENEFHITFPAAALASENFYSIETMASLVAELTAARRDREARGKESA
jgi:acyl carrier protein